MLYIGSLVTPIVLIIGNCEFFKEAASGQARETAAETSERALQPHPSRCE